MREFKIVKLNPSTHQRLKEACVKSKVTMVDALDRAVVQYLQALKQAKSSPSAEGSRT